MMRDPKRYTYMRPYEYTPATPEQLKEAIQTLLKNGYTIEEIAQRCGHSVYTIKGMLDATPNSQGSAGTTASPQ